MTSTVIDVAASTNRKSGGRTAKPKPGGKKTAAKPPRSSSSLAPWVLTLALAAGAGGGGYYLYEKYQLTRDSLAQSRAELAVAHRRAAAADARVMEVRAELSRAEGEFAQQQQLAKEQKQLAQAKAAEADELAKQLETLISSDQGEVTSEDGRIRLQLLDRVLFRSGEAELTARGKLVIGKLGEALNKFPDKQVWVQGHTDTVPIATADFASNWELASGRALNVVHYLQDDVGVEPSRMAAVAFSQYRPVSNRHKFKNRRIEIVLYPREMKVAD